MDTRTQVKQYVDIAWRRRWWLILPTILGIAVGLYRYTSLPKTFRATTTVLVIRQSVPEDIVRSTVTMRIEERMKTLKVQVLSRRYLEQVAREIGMLNDRATEARVEQACQQLRESVDLEWDKRDTSWFRINVEDQDPRRAAKVANRLAEMFIQQNTELREIQAKISVDTVETWLVQKKEELDMRDKEIADYRSRNLNELPEQEASSIQLLAASQNRVAQLSGDIQHRTDRLAILRAEEKANRANAAALGVGVPGTDPNAQALARLEQELRDLLVNYTDENPLVRKKRDQIEQFKALHPALATSVAESGGEPAASPEVQGLQADIRSLEAERDREQRKVDELRSRIANIPLRQQELGRMTRGYEQLKAAYDKTLAQKEQAQRSFDLESAKKGEQFQIQDSARPPAVPFEPQLSMLLILGLAAGLGLGVGLAALLEFLDQSVRGEEDFGNQFPDIPILGSIPSLTDGKQIKPRFLSRASKDRAAVVVAALAIVLGGPAV